MASTLSPSESAQLAQTVEMFEVIAQSQPQDYQSLEILKEAYSKLGRDKDVIHTSRRIAEAYVKMGQLSSAILEYETILQRCPNDPEIQQILKDIEGQAHNLSGTNGQTNGHGNSNGNGHTTHTTFTRRNGDTGLVLKTAATPTKLTVDVDDGRRSMHKLFVDGKLIAASDFEACWPKSDLTKPPQGVVEPFIQVLADKAVMPVDKSLKILSDKTRFAYLPLQSYDNDMDLARSFPAETCQRWCVLPFDRMSKSILVATANPFNQQAAKELAAATPNRLLWYLVPPAELVKNIRKAFR